MKTNKSIKKEKMDSEDDQKPPSRGGASRKERTEQNMTEINRQVQQQERSMAVQATRRSSSSSADDDDDLEERMDERKMAANSSNQAERNTAAASSGSRSQESIDDSLQDRASNSCLERLEQRMADVPSSQSSSQPWAAHLSSPRASTESDPHRPVLLETSMDERHESEPLDVNLTGPVVNVSRDGSRRPYGAAASSVTHSYTATPAPTNWMAVPGSTLASLPQATTTTLIKIRPSITANEGPTPGAYQVIDEEAVGSFPSWLQQPDQNQNTSRSRVNPAMRVPNIPVSDSHIPPELRSQSNSTVPPVLQASNSEFTPTTPGQLPDATCSRSSGNNGTNIDTDAKRVKRRVLYWLAGIALLIACIGAVVGIVVSLQKSDSPTTLPADFPSASPTFSEGFLVELIQSKSPTTSFVNSTSAQSQALDWMLSDPYTLNLEQDARLVQRFALVTLWYSTNGAIWSSTDDTNYSGGWLESIHECDWDAFGDGKKDLVCNSNKEVIQITLLRHGEDLSGHLPAELGLLSRLAQLDVTTNALSGIIPTELALLTGLSRLDLSVNTLSGNIPTEFGLLTMLSVLKLDSNTLSDRIPTELGLLSELSELGLWDNNLSGTIPKELGLLTDLVYFSSFLNTLSGTIPTELGLLTDLKWLELDDNTMTGSIPTEVGLLMGLTTVSLHNNTLIGTIPTEVGLLTKLVDFKVSLNVLSGTIPSEIGLLEALDLLFINNNTLSGSVPTEMGLLAGEIYLFNNDLSGTIPSSLCRPKGARPVIDCGEIVCTCCRDGRTGYSACALP